MDYLSNFHLKQSWLTTTTGVITITVTALILLISIIVMGAFSSKNRMPVEGRTVLLTGASEGMGRSAAIQLSAKGANVILVARNVGRLEETLSAVKSAAKYPDRQRFTYISADVAEPGYASTVIAESIAWNGGQSPDIVWCVAGMSTPLLWADESSDVMAATRRNMDVNFFGAAEMSRAILLEWLKPSTPSFTPPHSPSSSPSEPKHIIFTASVLALFAIVGYGPYSPSKWAIRGLADTLAMELNLYPENPVRVHVVYPATITSPGLLRENQTKPGITMELEKDEPPETPDTVAKRAIQGLEKGKYFVTVSFLGELMRCGVMGGSPRNNWFVDTVLGWFIPIIYYFVLWDLNAVNSSVGCSSMKSVFRPQRGRPSKVTKPSAPPTRGRPTRQAAAQQLAAAHEAGLIDSDIKPDGTTDPNVFDDEGRMVTDDYAAAAAAAAAAMGADMSAAAVGDGQGEAEADADMDDDRDDGGHDGHDDQSGQHDDPSAGTSVLDPQIDLAAASILANGGGGGAGVSVPSSVIQDQQQSLSPEMQQPQQQQQQQQQLGLQHAQQQVHPQYQQMPQHYQPHLQQQIQAAQQQLQAQAQQQAMAAQPQHHHSSHHSSVDPALSGARTTEEFSRDSGYENLNVESALAKRLAREPGQRHAQQRRPEQVLNLARRSNVEALFAHIAGQPARVPCKNCHKGHGPWTSCIIVDGQMCGSCANCWFNASGARCSFHETRNPQVIPPQQTAHHPALMSTPASVAGLSAGADHYNQHARFASVPYTPVTHGGGGASMIAGAGVGQAALGNLMTSNPMLLHAINRAMGEVRSSDKATRQLIQIESTARQLAIQIADYEDMINGVGVVGGGGGGGHHQHHQEPPGGSGGHQQQQQQVAGMDEDDRGGV
ncbi:hypothetical protein QBC46DRAFT_360916 [Diplogelasinospora grovesii]|uniref:3-dehydrosphinganine reductase n=1 Tax=Diplogelasinospora grovesii TaxID=303347 RepID=A0AAN6S8N9_9PEZI|nr:hypothetical protein QBC46DRAFT_360916 [Diplogelasinospora grovesii]